MSVQVRVLALAAVCLTLAFPPSGAQSLGMYDSSGPDALWAARLDKGTLLAWTPADEPLSVYYKIYAGDSPDSMVLIDTTRATSYFAPHDDLDSPPNYYGVSIVHGHMESRQTTVEMEGSAGCLSVGMNGSVSVAPGRCLPMVA